MFRIVFIVLSFLVWSGATASAAEPSAPALPVTLEADQVNYDHQSQTVTAKGNVVVEHQSLKLTATSLVYDVKQDRLLAREGVTIVDDKGNIFQAQEVELYDELSRGVIHQLRLDLAGDAWIVAEKAERRSITKARMTGAAFSPCKVCEDNPTPLWQITASEVRHDAEEQNISYNNASFEFMGVPIMWLPYFTHPDPTVKRRTGFLIPSFSSNSELGSLVEIPYHWAIAPHRDLTLTPVVATKELGYLKGEYRQRLYDGRYEFNGSITHVDQRDDQNNRLGRKVIRGHLFGNGYIDLDAVERIGFKLAHTSDDTY
ncbi:MAG: LPS-assembly protein LptD, partial [Alphaproteobacteria bacterium]